MSTTSNVAINLQRVVRLSSPTSHVLTTDGSSCFVGQIFHSVHLRTPVKSTKFLEFSYMKSHEHHLQRRYKFAASRPTKFTDEPRAHNRRLKLFRGSNLPFGSPPHSSKVDKVFGVQLYEIA